MSKVYVVISDSIIQGHESHGLHGVFVDENLAKSTAISAITSIAKRNYHDITEQDICDHCDLEYSYHSSNMAIYVSCLEEEVRYV